MKINWSTVVTTLTGLAIVAFVGGIWDFQTIKAQVKTLQLHDREKSKTLKAVGIIVCYYANKDKMPDAKQICKDVLN
tara:strand:- start:222 stop:452 length:231 start_codon:yes stop_codon:yes gene_type:complete